MTIQGEGTMKVPACSEAQLKSRGKRYVITGLHDRDARAGRDRTSLESRSEFYVQTDFGGVFLNVGCYSYFSRRSTTIHFDFQGELNVKTA